MRMTALQGASLSKVANDSYLAEPFAQRSLVSRKTVLKLSGLDFIRRNDLSISSVADHLLMENG